MNECSVCGELFHEPDRIPGPVEFGEAWGVDYAMPTEIETCPNCGAESECFLDTEEPGQFRRDRRTA